LNGFVICESFERAPNAYDDRIQRAGGQVAEAIEQPTTTTNVSDVPTSAVGWSITGSS
jgi:hypothetical protein